MDNLSKLEEFIKSEEEPIKFKNYAESKTIPAYCCKVVDGDTVHLVYDMLFGMAPDNPVWCKATVRIAGYNSAELHSRKSDEAEKQAEEEKGQEAKQALSDLLLGKYVEATYVNLGMYSRPTMTIKLHDGKKYIDVTEYMISNGYGAEYHGYGKKNY